MPPIRKQKSPITMKQFEQDNKGKGKGTNNKTKKKIPNGKGKGTNVTQKALLRKLKDAGNFEYQQMETSNTLKILNEHFIGKKYRKKNKNFYYTMELAPGVGDRSYKVKMKPSYETTKKDTTHNLPIFINFQNIKDLVKELKAKQLVRYDMLTSKSEPYIIHDETLQRQDSETSVQTAPVIPAAQKTKLTQLFKDINDGSFDEKLEEDLAKLKDHQLKLDKLNELKDENKSVRLILAGFDEANKRAEKLYNSNHSESQQAKLNEQMEEFDKQLNFVPVPPQEENRGDRPPRPGRTLRITTATDSLDNAKKIIEAKIREEAAAAKREEK